MMQHIKIYTDGGCQPNPGRGGVGAVLLYKDFVGYGWEDVAMEVCKYFPDKTTNQRMELTAAITGLMSLPGHVITHWVKITLYTDSEYVANGMNTWITYWRRCGWKNKRNNDVVNKDLWVILDMVVDNLPVPVEFKWVRSHNNHKLNDRSDQLATMAIKSKSDMKRKTIKQKTS